MLVVDFHDGVVVERSVKVVVSVEGWSKIAVEEVFMDER
jgi:hypothetical protein